jgi:hypothetical protein
MYRIGFLFEIYGYIFTQLLAINRVVELGRLHFLKLDVVKNFQLLKTSGLRNFIFLKLIAEIDFNSSVLYVSLSEESLVLKYSAAFVVCEPLNAKSSLVKFAILSLGFI